MKKLFIINQSLVRLTNLGFSLDYFYDISFSKFNDVKLQGQYHSDVALILGKNNLPVNISPSGFLVSKFPLAITFDDEGKEAVITVNIEITLT